MLSKKKWSYVVKRRSVKVEFMNDNIGTIVARTCSNLVIFPCGIMIIMNSVVELDLKGLKFNAV